MGSTLLFSVMAGGTAESVAAVVGMAAAPVSDTAVVVFPVGIDVSPVGDCTVVLTKNVTVSLSSTPVDAVLRMDAV